MIVTNILHDNIGFIELVDSMGNDLTVVNSARVSFGKTKTEIDDTDIKLIKYLAKHKHWSPFRHIQFQFHVKAPEIVGRQWYKHCIGSEYTFKDHAWNEISGRYIVYDNEFYIPSKFRQQSQSNKQASTDQEVQFSDQANKLYRDTINNVYQAYTTLIQDYGVSKEQARGLLPVSFYTEWRWTASLQAIVNFISLRQTDHAQWETRQYSNAMANIVSQIIPNSFQALMDNYGT